MTQILINNDPAAIIVSQVPGVGPPGGGGGGGGGITTEQAVDAVAAALTEGAGIDITYNDLANQITIAVINMVANLGGCTGILRVTQAEYNAIVTPVATVLYLITP